MSIAHHSPQPRLPVPVHVHPPWGPRKSLRGDMLRLVVKSSVLVEFRQPLSIFVNSPRGMSGDQLPLRQTRSALECSDTRRMGPSGGIPSKSRDLAPTYGQPPLPSTTAVLSFDVSVAHHCIPAARLLGTAEQFSEPPD